ncbi:MAG: hypothetical protein WCJ17_03465, partial [bacterium]
QAVPVDDTALISGSGSFVNDITVSSGAQLSLAWDGPLDTHIMLSGGIDETATRTLLKNNLLFKKGFFFHSPYDDQVNALNYIDCNGYQLFFGGGGSSPTTIDSFLCFENAHLQLLGPVSLSSPLMLAAGEGFVCGRGHVITFTDSGGFVNGTDITSTVTDLILEGVSGSSFAGSGTWNLRNVTLRNSYGALFVSGTFVDTWTNLLGGTGTIENATISLERDTVFGGTWTMLGISIVEGNGHRLDMGAGNIVVLNGSELSLCNVILENVSTGSFGGDGIVHLSDVTIMFTDADVDWTGYRPQFVIDGPVTFVTGSRAVVVHSGSSINNATLWYDTCGTGDANNVSGFTGEGRVKYVDTESVGIAGGTTFTEDAVADRDEYLYPELRGAAGAVLRFESAAALTYNGQGHRLICPSIMSGMLADDETEAVLFVGDGSTDTIARLENVTLEGFKPQHLQCRGGADALIFSDRTTLVLKQDWIDDNFLNQALFFGSDIAAEDEEVCIDLQGHTISLASTNARLVMRGAATSSLRIKNGRLIAVGDNFAGEDPSLVSVGGAKIILEDVELCLTRTLSIVDYPLDIVGYCSVSGDNAPEMYFISDDINFTITSQATLSLRDGVTYNHCSNAAHTFVFADATATLELVGATFQGRVFGELEGDPLVLKTGSMIIDHIAEINVGDRGVQLGDQLVGDDLHLIIRPSATLKITGTGGLAYQNSY